MLPYNSVGWQPVAELEIFNLHHHGNIFRCQGSSCILMVMGTVLCK